MSDEAEQRHYSRHGLHIKKLWNAKCRGLKWADYHGMTEDGVETDAEGRHIAGMALVYGRTCVATGTHRLYYGNPELALDLDLDTVLNCKTIDELREYVETEYAIAVCKL